MPRTLLSQAWDRGFSARIKENAVTPLLAKPLKSTDPTYAPDVYRLPHRRPSDAMPPGMHLPNRVPIFACRKGRMSTSRRIALCGAPRAYHGPRRIAHW